MERVFAVAISDVFQPAANFDTIGSLVSVVVRNAFVLAGLIAFVFLVIGGLGFIAGAGAGDTKKLEQGQKTITGAAMGLIVIVGAVWIMLIIEKLTGLEGKLVPFWTG